MPGHASLFTEDMRVCRRSLYRGMQHLPDKQHWGCQRAAETAQYPGRLCHLVRLCRWIGYPAEGPIRR